MCRPPHGGADPGAVYDGRQEKDDNLELALAVGKLLENQGIDVVYTRTTDIYQTPFEKAQIANRSGADYFISFHRNSSPEPNQYNGVETLVYDKSGLKLTMAENINGALEDLGFKNLGVKARPGLVVLRRTRMPALLVEAGFLNTDQDNQLFDAKKEEMARGIANAILGTLDLETIESGETPMPAPPEPEDETDESTYYRVQVGSFRERPNADKLLYELLDQGYPAFILYEDGYYKVQVGAFKILANAILMEQRLRRAGFSTFITT
ncbi:MAG TPA: N-acetylmuramoyl-L-alanine amidase [Candidatus Scatomonas pullistercoris]|uniref:N-acetylmuramoyl-L-alanine amidase n=1 Tax=Candidatus Scatomonas pullistercoris TaxID=2840920 RepID=A0A9D1P376_9FIRM|nr:N-acetylmuramoyl-L-alanine amidase [Candidatus Scatomonas pullistercoris]